MAGKNAQGSYFSEIIYDMISVKRKPQRNEDREQGKDDFIFAIMGKCKACYYCKKRQNRYQISYLLG